MERNEKIDILRNIILMSILIALVVIVPKVIGLGKQGFDVDQIFNKFVFYVSITIVSISILGLYTAEKIIKKDDNKYGDSICFNSLGELPAVPFFKKAKPFQLFLGFLIFFTILGLVNFLTAQQQFIGVGTLQQQFTKYDNLLFSTTLVTISENLDGFLIIALSLFGLRWLARKYDWSKVSFLILTYAFVPIAEGLYGMVNHLSRGYTDAGLGSTFVTWWFGGLITLLTGSFLPFWAIHIDNNLFYDLKKFFSFDIAWIAVFFGIILLIVLYLWLYVFRRKKEAKPIV